MKNWEYNNELISGYLEPESLEKQAINVFVEKLIDQVTDRGAKEYSGIDSEYRRIL